MKTLRLSNGMNTFIDDADYAELRKHSWCAAEAPKGSGQYYAVRSSKWVNGKPGRTISMARTLLGLEPGDGKIAEHANHATLDNTRTNIRIATRAQNRQNAKMQKNNTSHYKGVSWSSTACKWVSQITAQGQHYILGYFKKAVDAAVVYDKAARVIHDEFALTNAMLGRYGK